MRQAQQKAGMGKVGEWGRRFWRNRSGGVALVTALAVPPLALLVCGGVDLGTVVNDRNRFQTVADAAALQAALQVGVSDPAGIAARDDAFVRSQLTDLSSRTTYTVDTQIASDNSTVTVTITGVRQSFFMNLLPPGGWKLAAHATAASLARTPLCVLSTGEDSISSIKMDTTAQLIAPQCMIQSNDDILVTQSATMKAAVVQSSGLASGNISPQPQVGAPAIADPFTNLQLSASQSGLGGLLNLSNPLGLGLCVPVDQILSAGLHVLPAGEHCGNIIVGKDTTLQLEPGNHYFVKGKLDLKNNATIKGDDVVLVFDDKSQFSFQDNAQVDLGGRKTGPLAGFVIATTRNNTSTFEISSDSARRLLGTIYIPSARLLVTGGDDKVADQSAWTVIVAKAIEMHGGPNLVVNANYAGSPVPVPAGVGPAGGETHLVK